MTIGVVVLAYGSPRAIDDLPDYYRHIRGGREPSPGQLAEVRSRYEAIGGSPLRDRTEAQARALAAALGEGGGAAVAVGYKHAPPFVEDAVTDVAGRGANRIVALPMTPHHSPATVGAYLDRARRAAPRGVEVVTVGSWHADPALVAFLADAVGAGLARLPERTKVLFSAHSLPKQVVAGDPYPRLVAETASAVAAAAGLDRWAGWSLTWQSAGLTGEGWLGPDLLGTIGDLASTGRADGVLVCPCGFAADHLEVLYDLDHEAARVADAAGLAFGRTAVVNDDPQVIAALAGRVLAAVEAR